jgi:very-short-patch-repair endonuclease
VRTFTHAVHEVLEHQGGVIARRDHPELARTLSRMRAGGELLAVMPGIYAVPALAGEVRTRIRAAMLWNADAVLTGAAAALVSFWPAIPLGQIDLALPRAPSCRPTGFRLTHRRIPAHLICRRGSLRFAAPALTALDLCEHLDGDAIDTALRTRAATLDAMQAALADTRWRTGNRLRRRLLLDSRDEPWSAAERRCHRLLREAGIVGWQSNYPVPGPDHRFFLDVAFPRQKVVLEIDGRLHQTDAALFESDRWRQNWLVLSGWRVLRFTWSMLTGRPDEVIQAVHSALRAATLSSATPWLR